MAKRMQPRNKSQQNILPLLLIGLGALALISAVVLSLVGGGQPAARQQETLPGDGVARIALADARAALDQGQIVLLDVRSADAFATGHIPGSVNIPLNELEARSGELDKADWIVTACT